MHIPAVGWVFVAAMEDVIEVNDPERLVVSIDEQPVQSIGETRAPIPGAPSRPARSRPVIRCGRRSSRTRGVQQPRPLPLLSGVLIPR